MISKDQIIRLIDFGFVCIWPLSNASLSVVDTKMHFFCQLLNTYLIPYSYIKLVFFSKGIGELKWGWGLGKVLVVLCLLQMEKMNIRVHF